MRKLDLDFLTPHRPGSWASWALLCAGVLLCGDALMSYTAARHAEQQADQLVVKVSSRTAPAVPSAARTDIPAEEYEKALEILDQATFPWGDMFGAMESIATEGVGILEFTPLPKDKRILLRGEAASFPAMLSLIAAMEQAPGFRDVLLERHEIKRGETQGSIVFTLSAHWEQP